MGSSSDVLEKGDELRRIASAPKTLAAGLSGRRLPVHDVGRDVVARNGRITALLDRDDAKGMTFGNGVGFLKGRAVT
jgi:hypothetical protein